tara:strand:+ start:12064 stop:12438 length:375 start_codon:yes stop_codon:yes gene_type:complete
MLEGLASILQVIVGLGLLNVWLIRARSATSYRGGDAQNLKSEFATYGLPSAAFYIVGGLKILAGVLLLVGFAYQPVVAPAAAVVAVLMAGAIVMHLKVGDPPSKSLPATLMLLMSAAICTIAYL